MSKHYLSKSVLVLSLFAAASGSGLIAKADETPAANDISAASPAASSNTAAADNQGNTALPTPEVPDSAPEQAAPAPVQAQTAQTSAAEPLPSAEKSTETVTNEAADSAPKVSTPVTAAAPVKEAVKTPDPVDGQTVDMRILSTTDLHTNLVNYDYYQDKVSQTVGLAKTAILIEEARKENSNIVLVDSGDTIQGTPLWYLQGSHQSG